MRKSYYYETAQELIRKYFKSKTDPIGVGPATVLTTSAVTTKDVPPMPTPLTGKQLLRKEPKPFWKPFNKRKRPVVPTEEKKIDPIVAERIAKVHAEFPHWYKSFAETVGYAGCDMSVTYGPDKKLSEIQALYYSKANSFMAKQLERCGDYCDAELITENPVTILMEIAIFDKEPEFLKETDAVDLTITYKNEYDHMSVQSIYKARILFIEGGSSVDSIANSKTVILCARDITPLEKIK